MTLPIAVRPILACALLALSLAAGAQTAAVAESAQTTTARKDGAAVRAALDSYIDAGRQGRSGIMRDAFLPQATIYGHGADGTLSGGPIATLFDYVDTHSPATELEAHVVSIEIFGTIAQARVESSNWHGARYTDLFQLLKVDGEWKILSKIYDTR